MRIFFIFLLTLLTISQYQCEILSCKTNCTTNEECWHEAIAYHSSELIEQLFSFSSLAVHVDNYQRTHSNEINDTILFIDKAFENQLSNELTHSNLTINLFDESKQLLIDFCKNLTLTPIDGINAIPSLVCSLSTCSSETMNLMVLFIITILIASFVLLMVIIQSFKTHRQVKRSKIFQHPVSFVNQFASNNSNINFHFN